MSEPNSPPPTQPRHIVVSGPEDLIPVPLFPPPCDSPPPLPPVAVETLERLLRNCAVPRIPGGVSQALVEDCKQLVFGQLQRFLHQYGDQTFAGCSVGITPFMGAVTLGTFYQKRRMLPVSLPVTGGARRLPFIRETCRELASILERVSGSDFPPVPTIGVCTWERQRLLKDRERAEDALYAQLQNWWRVLSGQQTAADANWRRSSSERLRAQALELERREQQLALRDEEIRRLQAAPPPATGPEPVPVITEGAATGPRNAPAARNHARKRARE